MIFYKILNGAQTGYGLSGGSGPRNSRQAVFHAFSCACHQTGIRLRSPNAARAITASPTNPAKTLPSSQAGHHLFLLFGDLLVLLRE